MAGLWSSIRFKLAQRRLHRRRGNFYYELSMSLRERVPMVTTMRKYETRARMRGTADALVYLEMLRGFQNGSMSMALKPIATPLELTMLDATQTAGDDSMADGLNFMAQTVEKVDRMRSTLIKALAYPVFLVSMFSTMLTMFAFYAVPVLVEMLPPKKWPPMGKVLYSTSYMVTQYGAYVLVVLAVLILAFLVSLNRWTGDIRRKLDNYFPYNIYRDFSGALLLVSLASMMNSGISLRTSLSRTQEFATPWLKWHVRRILLNLSRANSPYFGQAFQTGVLNTDMSDRVQDASERRNPIEAFIRTGNRAIDLMVAILERRARVINIVMLVVCGLILALMFAGFISTTMSMQDGLRTR